ncbi:hypothetical protein NC653_014064 [Populus alba x Populus x berolinensis]|uniref:Uncharacterized protein n=1 Tax=Populus alba x Populus x berolinensis TaxID=444605 RepID=A0AAD6QXB0_9ROSI|nr:hypothetical protein NC653_014064 [Populus alba x Populus x berolinensis]
MQPSVLETGLQLPGSLSVVATTPQGGGFRCTMSKSLDRHSIVIGGRQLVSFKLKIGTPNGKEGNKVNINKRVGGACSSLSVYIGNKCADWLANHGDAKTQRFIPVSQ